MATNQAPITLESAIRWAKSGNESDKVYRFLFLHPDDLFTIPKRRAWSIAHQIVYNGDVFFLKRVLALYYDDQINIRTPAADEAKSTLLDVARSRRDLCKDMCKYVEDLFLCDDLIQAARNENWKEVEQLLKDHPRLINEKPCYSTYFVLHYLVQNGDRNRLENFFRRFRFDSNVYSADRETPVDLARRLRRDDLCLVLESAAYRDRSDSDSTRCSLMAPPASTTTTATSLPYPKVDQFPSPNFSSNSIVLTEAGDYELQKKSPFSVIAPAFFGSNQTTETSAQHAEPSGSKDGQLTNLTTDSASKPSLTPATPATKQQLKKNFICPLTQELFVDPVIASDGQTYERAAIAEWLEKYECSPKTGVHMDDTLTPNDELRQLIHSMRK